MTMPTTKRESNPDNAGIYLLEMLVVEEAGLTVGKLGEFALRPGYYYYIGSAQRNLEQRIQRHLRTEKRIRWHIDYFLQKAQILRVYTWPAGKELECKLGEYLRRFPAGMVPIPGFGASDCKCETHLYYFSYRPNLANLLHSVREELGLAGDVRQERTG